MDHLLLQPHAGPGRRLQGPRRLGRPRQGGQYVFNEAALAIKAAEALGQKIELMDEMMDREARLKTSKPGRLAVEIEKQKDDNPKKCPAGSTRRQVGPHL